MLKVRLAVIAAFPVVTEYVVMHTVVRIKICYDIMWWSMKLLNNVFLRFRVADLRLLQSGRLIFNAVARTIKKKEKKRIGHSWP